MPKLVDLEDVKYIEKEFLSERLSGELLQTIDPSESTLRNEMLDKNNDLFKGFSF